MAWKSLPGRRDSGWPGPFSTLPKVLSGPPGPCLAFGYGASQIRKGPPSVMGASQIWEGLSELCAGPAGTFGECGSEAEVQTWMRYNIFLLLEVGTFPALVELLNMERE